MTASYKQLQPKVSRLLLNEHAGMPEHVSALSIYEQRGLKGDVVRFKQILARVENRLARFPFLRQRIYSLPLDLDYPYLIDDKDFDIEFHVRHLALPAPGDRRQLCIQVSRLHARKLDRDRPMWEMYVIEGLNHLEGIPSGSFAIMLKIHLGLLDGVAAHEILGMMHDDEDDFPTTPPQTESPKEMPPMHELALRGFCNNLIGAFGLAQFSAIEAATQGLRQMEGLVAPRFGGLRDTAEKIPRTRFDTRLSSYRVFDGLILPMPEIIKISKKLKASLGDLTVSLCAGALHGYLGGKGELPRESLRSYVSWAHSASAFEDDLAGQMAFPELVADIGTQFADPVTRLEFLRGHLKQQVERTSLADGSRKNAEELANHLPAPWQAFLARMSYSQNDPQQVADKQRHCSIRLIEDANGSDTLLGASRLAVTYLAPLAHGCGLGFVASHDEQSLMITFTADRHQIQDPEALRAELWRSYQAHKAALTR